MNAAILKQGSEIIRYKQIKARLTYKTSWLTCNPVPSPPLRGIKCQAQRRTRGIPNGGDNPSAPPLSSIPPVLLKAPFQTQRKYFFFDSTGSLSPGRLAGWGQGSPGAALPASQVILVQSNWSIPRSFQAPHLVAGGRGAPVLKAATVATLAQTLPGPSQRRTLNHLYLRRARRPKQPERKPDLPVRFPVHWHTGCAEGTTLLRGL